MSVICVIEVQETEITCFPHYRLAAGTRIKYDSAQCMSHFDKLKKEKVRLI